MTVCDAHEAVWDCKKELSSNEGYLLSAEFMQNSVVQEKLVDKFTKADSYLGIKSSREQWKAKLKSSQGSSPWLICEECIAILNLSEEDKNIARQIGMKWWQNHNIAGYIPKASAQITDAKTERYSTDQKTEILSPLAQSINNTIEMMDLHPEEMNNLMLKIISLGEEGIPATIELFKRSQFDKRSLLFPVFGVWAEKHKSARDFLNEVSEGSIPASDFDRQMAQTLLKKDKSKSCFIATAACGTDSMEVRILRQFRDEVLIKKFLGRYFVRTYYMISPPVASLIQKSPKAKQAVRSVFVRPLAKYACKKLGLSEELHWRFVYD